MSGFLIGAIVVVVLWIFVSMSTKISTQQAFNVLDAANPWLTSEGILPASVAFSSYSGNGLSKHNGATILVGQGNKQDGSRVGFVLEVFSELGVVDAVYIQPEGIITHHRAAVNNAKMNNRSLSETLQEMARQHRQRYPSSDLELSEKVTICCSACSQQLSVPAGKRLNVTCPKCKNTFVHGA